MLELEQALEKLLAAIRGLPSETIPVRDALNRISAEPIPARCDLPVFDNSAMDGYAVRAEDVSGAGVGTPIRLRVIGRVAAGEVLETAVTPGSCARIFTGSPLPPGADAVVMQEDTQPDTSNADTVLITDGVRPFENVRLRGEEIRATTEVVRAGMRLSPGKIGLLGAVGIDQVSVSRKPSVALIGTGSELIEPGGALPGGKIFESNRQMLAGALVSAGAIPKVFPLVPDTMAATRDALQRGFEEADAVVTSGGVSVGEYDFVKSAFEELGGKLNFWKVAIKPGKPFVFGRLEEKFFFGLPGNPVSAFVTFMLLVRPALLRWQGAEEVHLPRHPGVLAEDLSNRGERRHFMCVRTGPDGKVRLSGLQASHALMALAQADGLVDVPPGRTLSAGATVQVVRLE